MPEKTDVPCFSQNGFAAQKVAKPPDRLRSTEADFVISYLLFLKALRKSSVPGDIYSSSERIA